MTIGAKLENGEWSIVPDRMQSSIAKDIVLHQGNLFLIGRRRIAEGMMVDITGDVTFYHLTPIEERDVNGDLKNLNRMLNRKIK